MKIRDIVITKIISVTPNTTYAEAAKLMLEHSLASVPVINEAKELIGILSEKDLFQGLYPSHSEYYQNRHRVIDQENYEDVVKDLEQKPISDYMTCDVHIIGLDDPVMKAGGIMLSKHIHSLPVLEDTKLVGIVSREDVFSALLKFHLGL